MRKFCLFGFAVLLNISAVFAQDPPPRKGVIVSSPSGLKPRPDNLPVPERRTFPANNPNSSRDIPDYIVYGTVFRMAAMDWLPQNVKFNPLETEICKKYRVEKILNERKEKFLQEVAKKTVEELNNLANRARPLTEEFRARMRSGMIVQGEERPMPPPELEEISKQRIVVVEEAIEKLKKNFGEKDFAKFNDFVNENVRSKIHSRSVPLQ